MDGFNIRRVWTFVNSVSRPKAIHYRVNVVGKTKDNSVIHKIQYKVGLLALQDILLEVS